MAIRQKTSVTMTASAASPSHSRTDVSIRDVTATIDEPVERGGTNLGMTPTEYATTSLMGCTNVIGNKCAKALGVDIGHLSQTIEVDFDRRGVLLVEEIDVPFTAIRLAVTVHGPASQADIDRVAVETEKYCPVSKMFIAAGTDVSVTWTKA